jgi:hypothetical protein
LNFQNLFNRDNFLAYSGVLTSPCFGQPNNVLNPQRVTLRLRFDFRFGPERCETVDDSGRYERRRV